MFRVLFLILILMSSFIFAQTEDGNAIKDPLPEAIKFDEFEKATNGNVKMRMDAFYVELNNDPSASGYIINYGTDKEIAKREKQIRNAMAFRKYDISRITFVRGGFREVVKTEFWLVPAGANPPSPFSETKPQNITEAFRFEKLGIHSERFYQWIFDEFFGVLKNRENLNAYILINANDSDYAAFEAKIRKYESFAKINSERIFFIKGKPQSPMTSELWFVPKGAELPKITPKAEKIDEFGIISNSEWRRRMKVIGKKAREIKDGDSQLFIINYGTEKEIAVAEQLIQKYLYENCRDCFGYSNFKINYIRGGFAKKARRVFWIVPAGAELPKP